MSNSGANFESLLPEQVVNSSKFLLNISSYGAVSNSDSTAAIKAAQEAAKKLPGNYGIFVPEGTFLYSSALKHEVPWKGVPRKSVLKQTGTGFVYAFGAAAIQNLGYQHTFNSSTAGNVYIEGIDFIFKNTESAEHTGIGLANVNGGRITDCYISTEGTGKLAPLDLFACTRNLVISQVHEKNTTEAANGGCWIRNLCEPGSEAEARENATENIVINDSSFGTSTGDEALSVFSSGGMVRHVYINRTSIEALTSSVSHNHIASIFLLTKSGEKPYAAVEDVEWNSCIFTDTTGNLSSGHQVLVFGQESDAGLVHTYLQNLRHVNCTFIVRTSGTATASTNIPNNYEGNSSGNAAINATVNAVGSAASVVGIKGFPKVISPTIIGNVSAETMEITELVRGNNISFLAETISEVESKASAILAKGVVYQYTLVNSAGVQLDFGTGIV